MAYTDVPILPTHAVTGSTAFGYEHSGFVLVRSALPLAGAPRPAPAGVSLWSLPNSLQPAGRLLGLLAILVARAPENHTAGHAPDRDGDVQVTGHTENVIFH